MIVITLKILSDREWQNRNLVDFVREKRSGEGTWIYVIDAGVEVNVLNVSTSYDPEMVQQPSRQRPNISTERRRIRVPERWCHTTRHSV